MTMKTKILILSAIIVFCIQAKNNDISYEETCYRYIVPHGPSIDPQALTLVYGTMKLQIIPIKTM